MDPVSEHEMDPISEHEMDSVSEHEMNPVSECKLHPISEPEMPVLGRSVSGCETDPSRRARCVRFLVDGSDGADNDDDDDDDNHEYGFGNSSGQDHLGFSQPVITMPQS